MVKKYYYRNLLYKLFHPLECLKSYLDIIICLTLKTILSI